jgi:hypothetical protein
MTRRETPDVDRLARSMLMLHGAHEDDHEHGDEENRRGSRSKAPTFADCRFCHVTVNVKKLGPEHTSVQWNSDATQRCAYFAEIRQAGGDSARTQSCPKLADSIKHAVAEGCLEEPSSPPSPDHG